MIYTTLCTFVIVTFQSGYHSEIGNNISLMMSYTYSPICAVVTLYLQISSDVYDTYAYKTHNSILL